jgi:hypothetical protein
MTLRKGECFTAFAGGVEKAEDLIGRVIAVIDVS